ncbi:MAG: 3-oxoacyl-ACP synthase [Bdellovibrionales bacterium RIFOXYC1_FULL_54_43]|nr:MAG: 3-oxoacyl-ACP synthase [Bdellovibrionales bacterium RIFOXYC1_FULL_54_43]OFZ83904.1 MAG: 3-oxoacyl-ACP synthase [Bdellovibrionales bacterium RIFOXYD1_FULL_55_31]
MKYSRIIGTGSYLPPRVWTNDDLRAIMDTSDEWIQQRTGIKERRWVDQDSTTSTSDLALQAARAALTSASLSRDDLDMIIVATLSPDHEFPGAACFLQAKLDVPGIAALDVRQQCTGFIYSLSIADQFIKTGMYKNILVVGAEVHSKGLDKTTAGRDVAVLFGDGAGAVVMTGSDDASKKAPRIISTHLHADGRFAKELWIKAPGSGDAAAWLTHEKLDAGEQFPKMNGKAVFVNAVKRMPEVISEALAANGLTVADVDLFVFHQANLRINEMVAKQLGAPDDKVFSTIERFGNTTAATIPIGLDEAVKAGKLKPGMLVASAAFGSGFTWGSALIRW